MDVQREGVVAPGHVLEPLLDPAVVLGVDDLLVAVVGPGVGAGRAERHAVLGRRARTGAGAGRAGRRSRPRDPRRARSGSRSRRRSARRRSRRRARGPRRRRRAAPRSGGRVRARRVEHRELLLEPDREVGRRVEGRAGAVEVGPHGREALLRSGRSTARRADRPPGWRCERSPRAGPAAAPRNS